MKALSTIPNEKQICLSMVSHKGERYLYRFLWEQKVEAMTAMVNDDIMGRLPKGASQVMVHEIMNTR